MEYDFAIIYFGLTRSLKKTHESHIQHIFNVLDANKLSYKKFMHTWKMKDGLQNVWDRIIPQKIDYSDYELLNPEHYSIDSQEEFLQTLNMDDYFYRDVWEKHGDSHHGEWIPMLVSNYLCMIQSQKMGFKMVRDTMLEGNTYRYIMFVRPDLMIHADLPLHEIADAETVHIPNHSHHEGLNDQFAIMNYENACLYAKRIDEIAEFRKTNGRIVAEKYCRFIFNKYKMKVNQIAFKYAITRP